MRVGQDDGAAQDRNPCRPSSGKPPMATPVNRANLIEAKPDS